MTLKGYWGYKQAAEAVDNVNIVSDGISVESMGAVTEATEKQEQQP